MPISAAEWEEGNDVVQASPQSNPAPSGAIHSFLTDHAEQAFTLIEIADNVDLPVGSTERGSGVVETVKAAVTGAGRKRVIKYFLNQLVAEGHVQTAVVVQNGNERVYYRAAKTE
ncbi:hypothetical protein [Halosegnis longus]|uniref:hypothetical protein n=1 Tax=Halosegnis longus TaxID=2216012 RepID=UPI00096A9F5F|nr:MULTISPECIES: hypothetical protein [Halobacteriales]